MLGVSSEDAANMRVKACRDRPVQSLRRAYAVSYNEKYVTEVSYLQPEVTQSLFVTVTDRN
jgi:hypothetical protein